MAAAAATVAGAVEGARLSMAIGLSALKPKNSAYLSENPFINLLVKMLVYSSFESWLLGSVSFQ